MTNGMEQNRTEQNGTEWMVYKNEGNEHFKQNNIKEAVEAYSKGLELCESDADKVVLYKNRSACYLKLEQFKEAASDADKVLKANPNDVKALFRRCQANETLGNIEPAYKDIKILIQREPKKLSNPGNLQKTEPNSPRDGQQTKQYIRHDQ